jgi:intraflagellar transport protein 172
MRGFGGAAVRHGLPDVRLLVLADDESVREFTSCAFNPSGDTAILGTYNKYLIFTYNAMRKTWEEVGQQAGAIWWA